MNSSLRYALLRLLHNAPVGMTSFLAPSSLVKDQPTLKKGRQSLFFGRYYTISFINVKHLIGYCIFYIVDSGVGLIFFVLLVLSPQVMESLVSSCNP